MWGEPDRKVQQRHFRMLVNKYQSRLSPKQLDLLSRRFGLNGHEVHSVVELARHLGVTYGRVHEILKRTYRRLRQHKALEEQEGGLVFFKDFSIQPTHFSWSCEHCHKTNVIPFARMTNNQSFTKYYEVKKGEEA